MRIDLWVPTANPFCHPRAPGRSSAPRPSSAGIGGHLGGRARRPVRGVRLLLPLRRGRQDPRPPGTGLLEPLNTLSFLAAHTTTVRLGTAMVLLPQRNPVYTAKEVATLDWLSNGRVDLGIGVGWLEEEFDAVNVPWPHRGAADRRVPGGARDAVVRRDLVVRGRVLLARTRARCSRSRSSSPGPRSTSAGRAMPPCGARPGAAQGWHTFNRTPEDLATPLARLDGLLRPRVASGPTSGSRCAPTSSRSMPTSPSSTPRPGPTPFGAHASPFERRRRAQPARRPPAGVRSGCLRPEPLSAGSLRAGLSPAWRPGAPPCPGAPRWSCRPPRRRSRARPGARRTSEVSATWVSIRASGAPRQWWIPKPKPRWLLGDRVTSNGLGVVELRRGRGCPRPAAAWRSRPRANSTPPNSSPRCMARPVSWTGET